MSECCICKGEATYPGYSPFPLKVDSHVCCANCYETLVVPVQLLCASLNLKSQEEAVAFGRRWLQAWRVRHYRRCENLIPDLIKEYRAKH